ncbi:hypothetical protein [Nitratifractor sp.]
MSETMWKVLGRSVWIVGIVAGAFMGDGCSRALGPSVERIEGAMLGTPEVVRETNGTGSIR